MNRFFFNVSAKKKPTVPLSEKKYVCTTWCILSSFWIAFDDKQSTKYADWVIQMYVKVLYVWRALEYYM